jgi:hypothetical protein
LSLTTKRKEISMSTPQSILSLLEYKVGKICDLLQGDDGTEEGKLDLIARLDHLELQLQDLINSHQRIENLLSLVLKVLAKDEK